MYLQLKMLHVYLHCVKCPCSIFAIAYHSNQYVLVVIHENVTLGHCKNTQGDVFTNHY